jgi:DNA-binding response OmpR family regulator
VAYRYRFDDVQIDVQSFRVFKGGMVLPVEPKALNLLVFLVENRGRLIERREPDRRGLGRRFCYRPRPEPRDRPVTQAVGGRP